MGQAGVCNIQIQVQDANYPMRARAILCMHDALFFYALECMA